MRSLVLFNNKGGVGKTTLTFHIAHMLARQGQRTVVIDYDPQCSLSTMFLKEDDLVLVWEDEERRSGSDPTTPARTVGGAVEPIYQGTGDVRDPELVEMADNLWLLPGQVSLLELEGELAAAWPLTTAANNERAFMVTTALARLSNRAAELVDADIVMVDIGPNLGALNRAALLACDAVVMAITPDLFALRGMKIGGPVLHQWREHCHQYLQPRASEKPLVHTFQPLGYVLQQPLPHVGRAPHVYQQWAEQIPAVFRQYVLSDTTPSAGELTPANDAHCIAVLKSFWSLSSIAQMAHKPIFDLKPADGIGAGHLLAVARAAQDFKNLVQSLLARLFASSAATAP